MPHSSQKNVNAPMDAWDRQRFGLALLEIEALLASLLVGLSEDARQMQQLERVRAAIRRATDETE